MSGPDSSGQPGDAVRALSWAWYDYRLDLMVRQPNPLAVTTSGRAVVALTITWWVLLVALGVSLARLTSGRSVAHPGLVWHRRDDPVVDPGAARTRSRHYSTVSSVIPSSPSPWSAVRCYAAWTVWTELITPRLARPETLVVQLDDASTVDATRRRLRRVLGDPSAQIVFPSARRLDR